MKEKSWLNVWRWYYKPTYYLKHPAKWIKEVSHKMKNSYDRATKGYCWQDWSEFASWFKYIAPEMLKHIADEGYGYPGVEPFEEPEKWHDWLHQMADQITRCQDEDTENEFYEPFMAMLMKDGKRTTEEDVELTELRKKYYTRTLEVMAEQKILFEETMIELLKHWDRLYD